LLRILIIVMDVVAAALGLLAAHHFWASQSLAVQGLHVLDWWQLMAPNPVMPAGVALIMAWLLVLKQVGMYDPAQGTSGPRIAGGITRAGAMMTTLVIVINFLMADRTYSRTLILSFCGASTVGIGLSRLALFKLQSLLPREIATQRVGILGVGEDAVQMAERLDRYGHRAFSLVGFIQPSTETDEFVVPVQKVLGQLIDLGQIVNAQNLQVLIQTTQRLSREESWLLANRADQMGIRLLQVPLTWGRANPRVNLARMGDLQLIDLTTLAYPTLGEQVKRGVDLMLVGLGLFVLLPVMAVIGACIKLGNDGPVFFAQFRAGRGGRKFPMYKFRSMVEGAEDQREDLSASNEADGVLFKVGDDPRVTRLGRHLRKWSLDELPQLVNVLRGDMNLVGPRPLPMADLAGIGTDAELRYWFDLRSKVKPGITGPWQISGRSELGMADMVRLDIDYIQNWSLWLDLSLLLKTLPAVMRRRGAS
jgi:exopolysaccharide biosynthesis polyprenyl glycosylphosphotransferase